MDILALPAQRLPHHVSTCSANQRNSAMIYIPVRQHVSAELERVQVCLVAAVNHALKRASGYCTCKGMQRYTVFMVPMVLSALRQLALVTPVTSLQIVARCTYCISVPPCHTHIDNTTSQCTGVVLLSRWTCALGCLQRPLCWQQATCMVSEHDRESAHQCLTSCLRHL